MDILKMVKEASAMKSKMNEVDKTLKEKVIEVDLNGVNIKMNAKSEIIDFKLSPDILKQDIETIEKDILKAFQRAIKISHDSMADEAKKLTGGIF